jgi:hypothetical protein
MKFEKGPQNHLQFGLIRYRGSPSGKLRFTGNEDNT